MSRLFELVRSKDISGVSGTGVVAEGVEYTDGSCAVRWKGAHPATAVWPSLADVLAVHGHQGDTVVRWVDQHELAGTAGALVTVAAIVASGLRYCSVSVSAVDLRQVKVHTAEVAQGFRAWIAALGGSVDDAVCSAWSVPGGSSHIWNWTSPDGLIGCFYLTNTPEEVRPISDGVTDVDPR